MYNSMDNCTMNRLNPLLFPIIVQKTISSLNHEDLKRCRLVCKLWEDVANRLLQIKKIPLTVSKNFDLDVELAVLKFHNFNYIIIPLDIGPLFFSITKTIIHEFQSQNVNVKFLELQNPGWSFSQLEEIILSLPKLQHLILSEDFLLPKLDRSSSDSCQLSPISQKLEFTNLISLQLNLKDENLQNLANIEFLFELYAIAPSLQEVKCWTGPFSEPPSPHTTIFSTLLFRSIVESRNLSQCMNVTSLDINLDLKNEDIDLLHRAQLPLKTLHLQLDIMISSVRVDNLLRSLTKTLKRLKLTHRNCIRSAPLFENMLNLEYLGIHGYDLELRTDPRRSDLSHSLDQNIFYIFNIVPLTMFPSFLDNFQNQLKKMKEIYLNSVYFISEDVFNFKKLFPNLRRVNMSFLNDEMLRSILKDFPQLESLIVKDGQITDSGITGISLDVQEILENGVTNPLRCGKLMEFTNISSLKCLRTLELSSPNITDFGVINGIAMCQSVQELELNFPKIGDLSLKNLMQNVSLDILRIKSGTFSKSVIEETRLKMEGGSFSLINKL